MAGVWQRRLGSRNHLAFLGVGSGSCAMVLLWLASYPDQAKRARFGDRAKRRRLSLPIVPWLEARLASNGIQVYRGRSCEGASVAGTVRITGICDVLPGSAWQGPLTEWPPEARVLQEYLGRPTDAFTATVVRGFALSSPRPVFVRYSSDTHKSARDGTLKPIGWGQPPDLLLPFGFDFCNVAVERGHLFGLTDDISLQEALQIWGMQPLALDRAKCLTLVEPIARLVALGEWETVMFLKRWGALSANVFQGYPTPQWWQQAAVAERVGDLTPALSPELCADLASSLRRWSPSICNHAEDAEVALGEHMLLSHFITWLEGCSQRLTSVSISDCRARALREIHAVLLRLSLRNDRSMPEVLPSACELLFPGLFDTGPNSPLQVATKAFPSRSTLQRAMFRLDAAFVLAHRQAAQEPQLLYFWCDSSPQGGRDWLISKHRVVSRSRVAAAAAAANFLSATPEPDPGPTMQSDDEQRTCHNATLAASITEHVQVPVALGSGRTTLEHKVAAFLHSTGVECGSLSALEAMCSSIVSFTTDLGTETGISEFQCVDCSTLLPTWLTAGALQPEELGDSREVPAEHAARFVFQRAIVIPGALHLLHSVMQGTEERLPHWPCFHAQLKLLEGLLSHQPRRERFIATCLLGSDKAHLASEFKHFSAGLYDKRWYSVVRFVLQIRNLLPVLKETWNHAAYQRFGAHRDQDGEEDSFKADDVTRVLDDPLFHGYTAMVSQLHGVPKSLASWMEGCSCHETLLSGQPSHRRGTFLHSQLGRSVCPMSGCRSCELAAGALEDVFTTLNSIAVGKLRQQVQTQLSAAQWATIIQDFELGRSHLHLGLRVKFAFWQKLPWRLCALNHWEESVARECARWCIADYDSIPVDHSGTLQHRTANTFLSKAGALRPHLDAFAEGIHPMHPDLRQHAAALRHIPVVERTIEAQHGYISKYIAAKSVVRPSVFSCVLRHAELQEQLRSNPQFRLALVDAYCVARGAKQLAVALGFGQHPDMLHLLASSHLSSSSVLQSSEELLYRCNLADQFRDLHLPRAEHTQATEASKRRTERMLIRNPPLGRLGLSEESVVVHCMEAHFKARVQTDAMYSLPASPGVFAGVQGSLQGILGASLASRLAVASQVSPSPFELDVEAVHAPTPRQELNFCRVLHLHAGRMKTVAAAGVAPSGLQQRDIAVTFHNHLTDSTAERPVVSVHPVSAGSNGSPIFILRGFDAFSEATLQQSCLAWKCDGELIYFSVKCRILQDLPPC